MTPPGLFDRWAPRVLTVLVGLLPLVFCLDMDDTFDLPKMSMVYAIVVILLGLWFWQALERGVLIFRQTALDIPLVTFLFVGLVSTYFSIDPILSLFGMYKIYAFGWVPVLAFATLFWLTAQLSSESLRLRIENAVGLAGIFVSIYALLQFAGYEIFLRMPKTEGGRVWSSLGNPIYLGAVCMMAVVVGASAWFQAKNQTSVFRRGVLLSIPCVGLLLSLSRGAWVGVMVGLGLIFYVYRTETRRVVRTTVILLGIGILTASTVPSVRERFSVLMSTQESSNASRIAGWKAGLQVARTHLWWGSGPDTFAQAFRPHRSLEYVRATGSSVTQGDAHNDFIQLAATQGLIGLLAWLGVLGLWFRELWRWRSIYPERVGFAAAVIALGVQNQFNFSAVTTSAWAAVFTGVLCGMDRPLREIKIPSFFHPIRWVLPIFITALFWTIYQPVYADQQFHQAKKWLAQGHELKALNYFQSAVRSQSRIPVYQSELANAFRRVAQLSAPGSQRERYFDLAWAEAESSVLKHVYLPDAWNNRGVVAMWLVQLAGRNLWQIARDSFERAVQLDPVFVDAWANLARWEHLKGNLENEKELWKKVLTMDPQHAMALQVLGLLP